jgi:hypothetical protein
MKIKEYLKIHGKVAPDMAPKCAGCMRTWPNKAFIREGDREPSYPLPPIEISAYETVPGWHPPLWGDGTRSSSLHTISHVRRGRMLSGYLTTQAKAGPALLFATSEP